MSTNIFDKIWLCPYTFEVYFNIPQKEKKSLFIYKFSCFYDQVNQLLLTCCFDYYEVVINEHNCQIKCFIRYFPKEKDLFFKKKRSNSLKNVSLNGKIIIGHCKGHNTITLIVLLDGFKGRTIRLYSKEVCCW